MGARGRDGGAFCAFGQSGAGVHLADQTVDGQGQTVALAETDSAYKPVFALWRTSG